MEGTKRNAWYRRAPSWASAVLLVGVVFGGYRCVGGESADADGGLTTRVLDRGDVVAKVTATGTLSALVTVQVGSQVSGRIAELHVDFNDEVKKGQVLARLDPQLFEAALAQARANDEAARANLAKAEADAKNSARQAERSRELARRELIAEADADSTDAAAAVARAQVEAATASVRQARAALDQAQVNLGYTTIVSPIDGIVISRDVDVGQTVAASLQAPTLFVLAEDLRKMQVNTSVAEADIGKLTPGMRAELTVDAYPDELFVGAVRQIRNAATTVQNVVTYDAVVDIDNERLLLRPGMTANVSFIIAARTGVLRLPNAALRYRPRVRPTGGEGGIAKAAPPHRAGAPERAVWVLRGTTPERTPVELGVTDGSYTEVTGGGLAPGDRVVVGGTASEAPARPAQQRPHGPRFL